MDKFVAQFLNSTYIWLNHNFAVWNQNNICVHCLFNSQSFEYLSNLWVRVHMFDHKAIGFNNDYLENDLMHQKSLMSISSILIILIYKKVSSPYYK